MLAFTVLHFSFHPSHIYSQQNVVHQLLWEQCQSSSPPLPLYPSPSLCTSVHSNPQCGMCQRGKRCVCASLSLLLLGMDPDNQPTGTHRLWFWRLKGSPEHLETQIPKGRLTTEHLGSETSHQAHWAGILQGKLQGRWHGWESKLRRCG